MALKKNNNVTMADEVFGQPRHSHSGQALATNCYTYVSSFYTWGVKGLNLIVVTTDSNLILNYFNVIISSTTQPLQLGFTMPHTEA